MKLVTSLLVAWVAAVCGHGSTAEAAMPTTPHIVFILADDLGWRDLSCYGSPFCETPHIDRLAREGLRFTQAYTAGAVCSPTRSSIMTGKYPVRTGVTDYIPGLKKPNEKLLTVPTKTELALEEITIGEALQQRGYQTFYAGKWHLGGKGFEPPQQGFDTYVSDAELGNHARDWQVSERMVDAAIKFLDERPREKPFFMYLGFHEPHTPILRYPRHIERFERKASKLPPAPPNIPEHDGQTRARQDDPVYGSEVAGLDEQVGRLLAKLDATGLAANTIVIFFSDNGGLAVKDTPGPTNNDPLRAGKGWLYEGGIRVPLIVRVPGVTKADSVCDVPVISTDLFPTLLELTGAPLMPQQHVDGVSIVSLLRGGASLDRQTLYWHYPHYHGSTWAPGAAIREGDWKLIELTHYGAVELYNLADDLSERRDLSKVHPERTQVLLTKLHAWQKATGAYIPQPNPAAPPKRAANDTKRAE
jgi:arylsulfatase A-like enzyme